MRISDWSSDVCSSDLPAVWIDVSLREQAQIAGYTVVDAGTVVATHLNHLMHRHGGNLLGRQEVQQLLDHVGKEAPKLIEDLVPKTISQIGRASCRERVCQYVYILVVAVRIKKK